VRSFFCLVSLHFFFSHKSPSPSLEEKPLFTVTNIMHPLQLTPLSSHCIEPSSCQRASLPTSSTVYGLRHILLVLPNLVNMTLFVYRLPKSSPAYCAVLRPVNCPIHAVTSAMGQLCLVCTQ
jgi:hypothetical protein